MRGSGGRDIDDDEMEPDANLLSVSIRPGDLIPDSGDAPQPMDFDLPSPPRVEEEEEAAAPAEIEIQDAEEPQYKEMPLPSPPQVFRAASRKSASPQKKQQQRSPVKSTLILFLEAQIEEVCLSDPGFFGGSRSH
jgi:hypothetical protein